MRPFKAASISDIHLHHARTPTVHILGNLSNAFMDDPSTKELDYIFFGGDLFERIMTLDDADVAIIDAWFYIFLTFCKRNNIAVRVLKGTPGHDWEQPNAMTRVNSLGKIGADLKYFNTLHVEYEQAHDMWCLFVPDEWGATANDTLSQVRELLKEKGIDQVDIAIMHGQFEYQISSNIHEYSQGQLHDHLAYLEIVRCLTFIGHDHTFSSFQNRIFAQGSFDRLGHGYEAPKGHIRFHVRSPDDYDIQFVINENAKRYDTYDYESMLTEDILPNLDKKMVLLPEDSYVRVKVNKGHPLLQASNIVKLRYPLHNVEVFTAKEPASKILADMKNKGEISDQVFKPIYITPNNIEDLISKKMKLLGLSDKRIAACLTILRRDMANVS